MSLAAQQKDDVEAVENLEKSTEAYPNAHLVLAQVFARKGKIGAARSELEDYLKTGRTEQHDQVKSRLVQLDTAQKDTKAVRHNVLLHGPVPLPRGRGLNPISRNLTFRQ